ncbi:MAG: zinc-ribbon domain-containing protein, partial [Anaeromyxobacteraceae bacterium]
MRLACTSCGKVYVVDEGLRGRAFRMRCKRCDTVIAVAGEAVEARAAPVAATDPRPAQAPAASGVEASASTDGDFADFSRELQDFAEELEREAAAPPARLRPVAPVSETPPV